jgi:alpha-L-fucosidase
MKHLFTVCFVLLIGISSVNAQWSVLGETTTKEADWQRYQMFTPEQWNASNFATEQEMEWFNDARYGMFIHFGLSTYKGKDLSWEICDTVKVPDRARGAYSSSVWTKWPEKFKLEKFDAKQWVEIAKKTGMKYIVVIAKHHDGFHLWNTKYSEFNIMNTPFGRDYLKELADACHKSGMKFGIYYSQRDWYHPDYAPVDPSLVDVVRTPPFYKAKAGVKQVRPGATHQKYIEYQFNVVRELCTNYGKLDVFWFDAAWWGGMFTAEMWESEKLTRMIRKLQPGIIINNRASIPGDFDTPEKKIGMHQLRSWESCVMLCGSWSWSPSPLKSKKNIIDMITATACGNGNLLLSWGPKWNGAFDPVQIDRLVEVGHWLKRYGYSIYNTKGGPWYPGDWGGSTYRENTVFVHITGEVDGHLILPPIDNKILSATCITKGKVKFKQNDKHVDINLEEIEVDSISTIIEITFTGDIQKMVGRASEVSRKVVPES